MSHRRLITALSELILFAERVVIELDQATYARQRHFGREPAREPGVAPSTLAHWEESRRCAPLPG